MKIITQCPFCGNTIELSEEYLDRRVRCGKCRYLFKIPHENELDPALKKLKGSKSTIYIDSKGNTYA